MFVYMTPECRSGRSGEEEKLVYGVITAGRDDPAGHSRRTQEPQVLGELKLQLDCGPFSTATYKESLCHKPTQAEETCGREQTSECLPGKIPIQAEGDYERGESTRVFSL